MTGDLTASKISNLDKILIGLILALWSIFVWASNQSYTGIVVCLLISVGLVHFLLCLRVFQGTLLPFKTIIICYFILRLLTFFSQPYMEDDYHRYLWDGIVTAEGGNALIVSPAEVLDDEASQFSAIENREEIIQQRRQYLAAEDLEEILVEINFPESPSIYGPVTLSFFALQTIPLKVYSTIFDKPSIPLSTRVFVLRFSFLLLESLSLGLFLALLYRLALPISYLGLMVLSPLLLKEVGNSLHMDLLPVALTLAATLCRLNGRVWLTGILLGLACAAKLYVLMLLPLFIFPVNKQSLRVFVVGMFTLVVCYLPWQLTGGAEIWTGMRYFSNLWVMNDFLTALIREILFHSFNLSDVSVVLNPLGEVQVNGVLQLSRIIGIGFFISGASYLLYHRRTDLDKPQIFICTASDILFLLYVCSSVQNPWYLLWGLPFHVLAKRKAYLLFIAFSQFYLLGLMLPVSVHILHPFQWWVFIGYALLLGYGIFEMVNSKKAGKALP